MTAVLLIGALGVIVAGSLGLALARAGSRQMPPMPVDQLEWQRFVEAHEWPEVTQ